MIYVIEYPHAGQARAWFAFDGDDFARKVYATDEKREWEIHSETTVRELLTMVGESPQSATAQARFPAICMLAAEHGWDTPLYRADYLLGDGSFQVAPVREVDALIAALTWRVKTCRIFWSDAEATAAIERDPDFDTREGYWAREALREQLVSLEVLEGPNG